MIHTQKRKISQTLNKNTKNKNKVEHLLTDQFSRPNKCQSEAHAHWAGARLHSVLLMSGREARPLYDCSITTGNHLVSVLAESIISLSL